MGRWMLCIRAKGLVAHFPRSILLRLIYRRASVIIQMRALQGSVL
jgi:hypothetical protein